MILLKVDILNSMPSGYYIQCYNTHAIIYHGHVSGPLRNPSTADAIILLSLFI